MSTAVARVAAAPVATVPNFPLARVVEEHRDTLRVFLPAGVDLERIVGELFLLCQKTPALAQVPPTKLIPALGRAIATGGVLGEDVYLVPFKGDVTVIVDYKYKVARIVQAGGARAITARAVYEKEHFEIHYGTEERIEHRPLAPSERGKLRGAYAIARVNAWTIKIEWMELADIEVIRSKSQSWSRGECPAWYAKKTVVNQIAKLLPKNPRLTPILAEIAAEEREEFGREIPVADVVATATIAEDDDFPGAAQETAPAWPAITTEAARAYLLPGDARHFKGYGGKPLRDVPRAVLEATVEWTQDTTYEHAAELRAHLLAVLEVDEESNEPSEATDAEPASRGRSDDTQVHVADATTGATRPGDASAELPLDDKRARPRNRVED
jgi:recombination protein RecT